MTYLTKSSIISINLQLVWPIYPKLKIANPNKPIPQKGI